MKRIIRISSTFFSLLILFSCGLETSVVNTVHADGSVTRRVIMKSDEKDIDPSSYRVPVDSTWVIEHSFEVNEHSDTTWILEAEKYFASVDEINHEYANDNGVNGNLNRSARFSKQFRWFTTVFRYTETIEKILEVDLPISQFLSEEETRFLYMPEAIQNELRQGKDSVMYKEMAERIETRSEQWMWSALIRQFIVTFYELAANDPELIFSKEELVSRTDHFIKILMEEEESQSDPDTTAVSGEGEGDDLADLIISVLGEDFYHHFKPLLDSTEIILDEMAQPFWSSGNYTMEFRMPGRITSSNGFFMESGDGDLITGVIWGVDGGFFLAQDYAMWVESRVNNLLFWIISGLFILFVASGFLIPSRKRRALI